MRLASSRVVYGRSLPNAVVGEWKGDEGFQRVKSKEQGAAMSVWAAVGREVEGKGGVYLEDCGVSG